MEKEKLKIMKIDKLEREKNIATSDKFYAIELSVVMGILTIIFSTRLKYFEDISRNIVLFYTIIFASFSIFGVYEAIKNSMDEKRISNEIENYKKSDHLSM